MIFNTADLLMIRKIIVFYMHHHMSASNPQIKDVEIILDKITEGLDAS
jgi:hypothetical protein|tara:strand:- start:3530 stop:3673 length:144 start_codon:yes stop_codon:yes gene_type:complete